MKKTLLIFSILLTILFLGLAYCGYILYSKNLNTESQKTQYAYVAQKISIEDFIEQEDAHHIFKNKNQFLRSAKLLGVDMIREGRYQITPKMSNFSLLKDLKQGVQKPMQLSFNNIRTKEQLSKTLSTKLNFDSLSMINLLNDSTFLSKYDLTPQTSVSIFIPNTYEVYWTITPENLFKRMVRESEKFWNENRLEKAQKTGLTKIEIITLASIIEEESNKKSEKPTIAGLYMNRLKKGMLLQSDPTVKFAIQDFTIRRILRVHLETDSPYNTYRYVGLPPGPIRIPSIESIDAVLNYQVHNYIYMTAKADFSGYHAFATTYEEHQKNAVAYRRALNKRRIFH